MASTKDSELAEVVRLALWTAGIVSLLMAIGLDGEIWKRLLRASSAAFFLGLVISMRLKTLRPNRRIAFLITRIIAVACGFVAVGLKVYDLLFLAPSPTIF